MRRMVKSSIEYAGGLRCVAVHGPSGSKIETDAPVDNHGKGERFSPTDLVATGLGLCMATVMGIVAEKRGVSLEGMKIDVTKEMSADAPRRISKLTLDITIPTAEDKVLVEAALNCPVAHSIHPDIECDVHFHWKA